MPYRCTCPPDGSFYCPRCAALLAHASSHALPISRQESGRHQGVSGASDVHMPRAALQHPSPVRDRFRSNTERRYAAVLETHKRAGDIDEWYYEPMKLRLAEKCFYSPDFLIRRADNLEIHEVKGFIREDSIVKLKVAARLYP